jgi:hypothetical protein
VTTFQLIILLAMFLMCGFLLLQKHILGPFVVHARNFMPREYQYEEISEEQAHILFPPQFFETISELNAIGFSLVCHLLSSSSRQTRMALSLLVNRDTKTVALTGRVAVKNPAAIRVPVGFLEFDSHFKDGSEINTINTPTVGVFYDVPEKVAHAVPHLRDAASLFRVHQYLVGQKSRPAVLPEPGTELDFLRAHNRRTLARQAELGYFFLDQSGEYYRLTWRAAFRSTYRLLWPAKQILQRRLERAGRRLAAEAMRAG